MATSKTVMLDRHLLQYPEKVTEAKLARWINNARVDIHLSQLLSGQFRPPEGVQSQDSPAC